MANRSMVRVWPWDRCQHVRELLPTRSVNKANIEYISHPEVFRVADERVGCRACGCPLDRGVEAIRVRVFSGHEKRREPASFSYLHRNECWADGFVQTTQLHGTLGTTRLVQGKVYDAFYDVNKPLITRPEGHEPTHVTFPIIFIKPAEAQSQIELARIQKEKSRHKMKENNKGKPIEPRGSGINAPQDTRRVKAYDVSAE